MPVYTDLQRAQLRQFMGYTKLFSTSNAIFENALNTIQSTLDDGSTFNLTVALIGKLLDIDTKRANNSALGLSTEVTGEVKYDAYRNDAMLKTIGRNYIKQLSIIFAMQPTEDYYGRSTVEKSGNIYSGGNMPDYDL